MAGSPSLQTRALTVFITGLAFSISWIFEMINFRLASSDNSHPTTDASVALSIGLPWSKSLAPIGRPPSLSPSGEASSEMPIRNVPKVWLVLVLNSRTITSFVPPGNSGGSWTSKAPTWSLPNCGSIAQPDLESPRTALFVRKSPAV